MRLVRNAVFIFLLVLVLVVVFRGPVLKAGVKAVASAVTGLTVDVGKIDIGFFKPVFEIGALKVYNAPAFPEKTMLDMPGLYVEYDLPAILKGTVALKQMKLDLAEFVVVKNKDGVSNVGELAALGQKKEEPAKKQAPMPPLRIDLLRLDIGRVVYKDFSVSPPSTRTFDINLHKEFQGITDAGQLMKIIVVEALLKSGLRGLADVDLGAISDSMTSVVGSGVAVATETATKTMEAGGKAVEETGKTISGTLKGIFPFGGKE